MDIFHVLTMLGGLCLFLFGMNFMGQSLERRAGGKLRTLLDKMTGSVGAGFLTGLGITAIIQSSSATTVMVVGFVNSGLMNLRQAINVIMGANVGTTVTAWLLSLAGIDGGSTWVQLLKPTSFTPVLALIGIIFYMFCKDSHKKDTGAILLGFATLMFGMDTMSGAVAGLKDVPGFAELFLAFTNPLLGVLVGAVLTAIIQSSSASVGILQALASTGQVSYAAAVPIIMGQNIGTCVTALISCVGTNKNAKRAAVVHLMFNVIGVAVLLTVFCIVKAIFAPALLNESATMAGIAIAHSAFNILCTAMLLPCGGLLEKLAVRLVPDRAQAEETVELDERLLATPSLALQRCRAVACDMAAQATIALQNALRSLEHYTPELAASIREDESRCDHYEDVLGTYLVKLSARKMGDDESEEAAELLKAIGDFERISDHAVNVLESAEERRSTPRAVRPHRRRGSYPDHVAGRLPGQERAAGAAGGAAGGGHRRPEGAAAHPPHPAHAAGTVQHRGGLRPLRPADGSGAHLRPLLQHRRLRHRRGAPRPEPPRHAGRRAPARPGFPRPLQDLRRRIQVIKNRDSRPCFFMGNYSQRPRAARSRAAASARWQVGRRNAALRCRSEPVSDATGVGNHLPLPPSEREVAARSADGGRDKALYFLSPSRLCRQPPHRGGLTARHRRAGDGSPRIGCPT